jgi:hypothetical protein
MRCQIGSARWKRGALRPLEAEAYVCTGFRIWKRPNGINEIDVLPSRSEQFRATGSQEKREAEVRTPTDIGLSLKRFVDSR